VFISPCWRQTHVFKHSDFSYAIELINFIITFNFAINSPFHFLVRYLFEGRRAANSCHFYYSAFCHLTLFTLSPLLSLSPLPPYSCSYHNYYCFSTSLYVPVISIIVTPHFVVKFAPTYGTISLRLLTYRQCVYPILNQWRTQEFCSGGVQQIKLGTEERIWGM